MHEVFKNNFDHTFDSNYSSRQLYCTGHESETKSGTYYFVSTMDPRFTPYSARIHIAVGNGVLDMRITF